MNSNEKNKIELINKIEEKEKKARKRILIYTLIPVIVAIVLIWVTSSQVINSKRELDKIQNELNTKILELEKIKSKVDTLDSKFSSTISSISEIISTSHRIENFIESKQSFLRSIDEARFLINIRMLFDEINSQYSDILALSSELPELDRGRNWITIISSSKSLNKLQNEAKTWIEQYGIDQVAIYKSKNNYYALALKGDGSFTKAYRLTVQLQRSGKAYGAYFASSKDWNKNYLE